MIESRSAQDFHIDPIKALSIYHFNVTFQFLSHNT